MRKYSYLLCLLLLLLSACSGEHAGTCIPSDGTSTSESGGDLASIDKFLLEKKPVSTTINTIKEKLFGQGGNGGTARKLFESFVNSSEFRTGVSAAFTLVVLFYGLGIGTGMLQMNGGDAIIRLAKLGFVVGMALSWDNFYGVIGNTFAGGRDELIGYMLESFKDSYKAMGGNTAPTTNEYLFADLDKFMAQIFSMHMFAIVSALFSVMGENSGPYALVYALFLISSLYFLFQSIIIVITAYVFSLFANVILFAFAPVFLVFMLFEKTKHLFDGWLKQTISYNLQPVALVAFLGLFIILLQPFLEEILALKVCYLSSDPTSGNTWQFVDPTTGKRLHFGVNSAPPIELKTLLMFFFFAWLFNGYLIVANQIVTAITATISTQLSQINMPFMNSVAGKGNFSQLFGVKGQN